MEMHPQYPTDEHAIYFKTFIKSLIQKSENIATFYKKLTQESEAIYG